MTTNRSSHKAHYLGEQYGTAGDVPGTIKIVRRGDATTCPDRECFSDGITVEPEMRGARG